MSEICENLYKICRNNRRFTQEHAAELLNIAPRTLSDYENGHAHIPDDIVAAMCEVYGAPMLALWHVKMTSVLGKYVPEIFMPVTNGDMAAQLCASAGKLRKVADDVIDLMFDGEINAYEREKFGCAMALVKQITAKLLSVSVYAENLKLKEGGATA